VDPLVTQMFGKHYIVLKHERIRISDNHCRRISRDRSPTLQFNGDEWAAKG